MKQYEAVIQTLEKLGGQATLAMLYTEVMKIKECQWGTKTPFASIRRIVQTRPEIFKVRPGLWALCSYKEKLGLTGSRNESDRMVEETHSYYQGLLVVIGNLRGFSTLVPNQDKNRLFVYKPLGELCTLRKIPRFSHDFLVRRTSTVDVVWFNSRQMPNSLFEVEYSTNIQTALLKFYELQDFYTRMVIVAHESRQREFEYKLRHAAFSEISQRVKFLGYSTLVRQYEYESLKASEPFVA